MIPIQENVFVTRPVCRDLHILLAINQATLIIFTPSMAGNVSEVPSFSHAVVAKNCKMAFLEAIELMECN